MARRDGIFPGESRLAGGDGKVKVYRMEFADGWGTMTAHAVMDGVTVIFNDFHTASGIQEEARCPGMVEINHCLAGRFECTMPDGRTAWLGPCDFAVSDMGRPPVESRFTQGLYQGISLVLDIRRASVSLQQMLGGEAPDLEALFEGLFESCSFLLLRSEPKIQHIFSELYHVPSEGQNAYYRLKTGELMLFLQERRKQMRRTGSFYYGMDRGRRVQEMGQRLTADLQARISISELAEEYGLGVSTVKKYFRQMYGEPPYAYLKRRRMEEAAFLLGRDERSVTEIAESVGYQNASKFSAAFRDIYGMSPLEYKKKSRLEQNARLE